MHLKVCMTLLINISNLTKCQCVLNFCSECPGVFVSDAEINCEEYMNLPFLSFNHYKNISSCSLHNQLLPKHGKIFPL